MGATQVIEIDALEAAWTLGLSNDPQRKFVGTTAIAANSERETPFVLFPAFQLLARKGVIGLVRKDLVLVFT